MLASWRNLKSKTCHFLTEMSFFYSPKKSGFQLGDKSYLDRNLTVTRHVTTKLGRWVDFLFVGVSCVLFIQSLGRLLGTQVKCSTENNDNTTGILANQID